MGKAQEAAAKRKNKAARKRLRSTSTVSEAVQAHIAAKRRRKDGKRRMCQGMCFTLPTPEDPFNDRWTGRGKKKLEEDNEENPALQQTEDVSVENDEPRIRPIAAVVHKLMVGREATVSRFQADLWKACAQDLDVLGTVEASNAPSLAYVPAAVSRIENGGLHKLSVLFLVSSREEALSARRTCMPLKDSLGIQTISIHSEAPIQHQVQGLKASPPEFLVATPERLCELLDVVSLSSVYFMVVENLEALVSKGWSSKLATIKSKVSPKAQLVLLSECYSDAGIEIARHLLDGRVTRVTAGRSLKDKAACVAQVATVIVDSSKKLSKLLSLMDQLKTDAQVSAVLVVVNRSDDGRRMAKLMSEKGHQTEAVLDLKDIKAARHKFRSGALICTEEMLGFIELSRVQVVVNYSFPCSMESYCEMVSGIARDSAFGLVHTFCGCSTAPVAARLVDVFKHCSQPVSSALELLAKAAAVVSTNLS